MVCALKDDLFFNSQLKRKKNWRRDYQHNDNQHNDTQHNSKKLALGIAGSLSVNM